MKYVGSKARFAKEIMSIILKDRCNNPYVEPFAGGMNSICEVDGGIRIANDSNHYLIAMWQKLVHENWMPSKVSRDMYNHIRENKDLYEPHIVGWIGFNCSYSGKWFGGYAGQVKTKIGTVRDYQDEAIRNIQKQVVKMKDVQFTSVDYRLMDISDNSIIYCDPPYQGTLGYADSFDNNIFWDWVRQKSLTNKVFVSEYNAPDDFKCVWQKTAKSSLSANGVIGGNKVSIEKLFTYNG